MMEWYWWVLIGVAVVVGGTIKLKVLGKWLENRKNKEPAYSEDE